MDCPCRSGVAGQAFHRSACGKDRRLVLPAEVRPPDYVVGTCVLARRTGRRVVRPVLSSSAAQAEDASIGSPVTRWGSPNAVLVLARCCQPDAALGRAFAPPAVRRGASANGARPSSEGSIGVLG